MVMAGEFHAAERHSIVTPLGVQFVDDFSGVPVGSGLEVWTWPEGAPSLRVPLRPAGSAMYAAHRLPGFRDFERGDGDDRFWTRRLAEPKRRFVVEARDLDARFLPMQVRVDLPAFGAARPFCSEMLPENRRSTVPLFSASTRPLPASVAVVRAELYDKSRQGPAAWAVVEGRFNGRTIARGMSDRAGRLALLFAYPEPQASWASPPMAVTSPAAAPMVPLAEQQWSIDLAVHYDRTLLQPDVRTGGDATAAIREAPDLCDALGQARAAFLADQASPSLELAGTTLRYGEANVLRTANTAGQERGRLLVITSGSPL
jgi:hypothetical protein